MHIHKNLLNLKKLTCKSNNYIHVAEVASVNHSMEVARNVKRLTNIFTNTVLCILGSKRILVLERQEGREGGRGGE